MARSDRFAAGYFFLGITVGASLAIQEFAGRRPNGGDIRGRTTGSAQAGRQGPAAIGTPLRHGPDKFISANNYSAEQSHTVHSRPTSTTVRGKQRLLREPRKVPAYIKAIGKARGNQFPPTIWGEEITE
jgi:hypothetical protein